LRVRTPSNAAFRPHDGRFVLVRPHRSAAALASGLIALVALVACVPPPPPANPPLPPGPPATAAPATPTTPTTPTIPSEAYACPSWTATSGNPVTDHRIQEASGLAASRVNPGLWWVHNDGPNSVEPVPASIYALDARGTIVATVDLTGATNIDWEDIDEVTIGGVSSIWVADTGDNGKIRPNVQLYRIQEPAITAPGQTIAMTPDVVTLDYPGGAAHNVETSFVDPATGDLYLVTKEVPPLVFRAPAASLVPGTTVQLSASIATLDALDYATNPAGRPAGGDLTADGTLLAIKTLDRTFMWHRSPGQSIQAMLRQKPAGDCIYDDVATVQQGITPALPDLGHGEAIAFTPDGRQLATIAEGGQVPLKLFRAP
jgi:hypothetical protein